MKLAFAAAILLEAKYMYETHYDKNLEKIKEIR